MKLSDVSEIFIGILVKREEKKGGEYQFAIFDLKNYENNENEYDIVETDKNLEYKLTKKGDLIFRLVYPNKIIYIDKKLQGMLVSSQWCIIRPQKINAKFLKWYLESDEGKENILTNISGSTVQKISVQSLKMLEIPEITLQQQKKLEDIIELWKKEKKILLEIINSKELLYKNLIEEFVKKENKAEKA